MLTDVEREILVQHLEKTAQQFRDSLAGLTGAQWTFAPGGAAWSIAGIAEHLIITEGNVLRRVQTTLLESPPSPEEWRAKAPHKDRMLLERVATDRNVKAQAPEASHPAGRMATPAEALAAFENARGRTLAYASGTLDDLRGHYSTHAALKELDGYQWLLLMGSHTARHVAQIAEVKSAPGYPSHA